MLPGGPTEETAGPAAERRPVWGKASAGRHQVQPRQGRGEPGSDMRRVTGRLLAPPALAAPVAKLPRTTSGVTQAGRPATGVREPTVNEPSARPSKTARQRRARSSARWRVSVSSWVSSVTKAFANWSRS
ncbi:hypothetical protein Srufu_077360 [Streptomyces libani subsp. rufus]|nr:hypothetical protein Srufu_077360 [Streptomyces libani subsp. rufus]